MELWSFVSCVYLINWIKRFKWRYKRYSKLILPVISLKSYTGARDNQEDDLFVERFIEVQSTRYCTKIRLQTKYKYISSYLKLAICNILHVGLFNILCSSLAILVDVLDVFRYLSRYTSGNMYHLWNWWDSKKLFILWFLDFERLLF